ncbi:MULTISPECIES: SseB family protein [Microbacterium]|uniref:SseB family protein n=1 Tax=Microbacterium wangchenii TaxID=2541726 RepID=A0ABX5ST64_9MICO|nr:MULTISPECIES: SseB family protein [Microbacterium]MCK6067042.1 SseB family protein [Microbacterium sp. EYE_512]QBR88333.1 SseB family protein [Microbacterium wangchenii]TFV83545.1 SseB family protein [Microbacterium sp. dk485]TXK17876.1 SseB family protein [Microbacterium wangchenii]
MSPEADPGADSAGVPWEGRRFESNPHAGDDGSADPALLAALTAFRAGEGDAVAVVEAYRSARLLIPLIAEKGDSGVGAHGLEVDKTQELSIVTVAAPDGRKVLPVFTSVAAMGRWDAAARPVPAEGVRTALAAASDDTDLIVIDPGSETEFVLRRPAVWAIGQGIAWEPSHVSAEVFTGLQASISGELAVLDLAVEPGDPTARLRGPELVVHLQLMHGLAQEELDAVLARVARRWAADDRIAVLVDSLTVKLHRSP